MLSNFFVGSSRSCQALTILAMLAILSGMLLSPAPSLAQDKGTISGKVTDAKGGVLPGANIFIKGTRLGAASAASGAYLIDNVPAGTHTLLCSFIGYYTMEVEVTVQGGQQTTQDFALKESVLQMDEIVVTGTGYELKKKELTTSVSTINARDIELKPVESIDQLLAGRVPGGVANPNTGEPGTGARIRVRGIKSATVSQTPVIYLDGVRVDNNDRFRLSNFTGGPSSSALNDILVGDIERVEVIKGGAAATLYGSEAASGVIQVFTKKGKAGPSRWSLKVEQGINTPEEKFIIEDFTKNEILQNGQYQKYTVGLDGGSELLTYHLSGHVLGSVGVLPKNDDKQYSFRVGARAFPSEKWQVDFSGGLIRDDFERMFSNNAIASVITSVEGHDADFFGPNVTDEDRLKLLGDYKGPDLKEAVNRFNFGSTAYFNPNDYFSTRLTLGMDYRKNEQRYFIPIGGAATIASRPGGGIDRADREFLTITLDYAGTIKYPNKGDITSNLTLGAQGFREEDRTSRVTASQFGLPGTDDFDNAATLAPQESNFEIFSGGVYVNEQLGYKGKLFLTAGVRVDGNTAFGDEVDLESYPKVGLAYSISDESFWQNLPWGSVLNQFKVRGSWGKTGSFPDPFTRDKQFTQGSFLGTVAANFGNPGDPTLGPEKTRTIEYGFDAALLKDRIGIEFTVFDEKTEDALFSVPSDPSTGLGFQLRNVGTVENSGIEVALDATVLDWDDLKFSLRGSFSTLDNKVASLGGAQPFSIGGFAFLPQRVEEGKPVGVFRTTRPADDPATPGLDSATEFNFSPVADNYYSISADFTILRNLQLSVLGTGQSGGEILNTGSVIRFFNGAAPEKAAGIPTGYTFATASVVFIEDATFFKIKEIAATYTVPKRYFGTQVRLNASVSNAFIFADNKDLDPELNGVRAGRDVDVGGINFFTLSPPRQFRFGLLLDF